MQRAYAGVLLVLVLLGCVAQVDNGNDPDPVAAEGQALNTAPSFELGVTSVTDVDDTAFEGAVSWTPALDQVAGGTAGESGFGWSEWSSFPRDPNPPTGVRVGLTSLAALGRILQTTDFRLLIRAVSRSGPGQWSFTPWASEGGGWSGPAYGIVAGQLSGPHAFTLADFEQPSAYQVAIETRSFSTFPVPTTSDVRVWVQGCSLNSANVSNFATACSIPGLGGRLAQTAWATSIPTGSASWSHTAPAPDGTSLYSQRINLELR